MEQRTYHGSRLSPDGMAQALLSEWDQGDFVAQAFGEGSEVVVQIGRRSEGWLSDEPRNALTVEFHAIDDGVQVTMGQQQWYQDQGGKVYVGGLIGFFPFFFTFPLGRLFGGEGDVAGSSLPSQVWKTIEGYVASYGAATGPTRRLATVPCPSCGVANPQGAEYCSACGANLVGDTATTTCHNCGYLNPVGARFCNQCGTRLAAAA